MEEFLKNQLKEKHNFNEDWTCWEYVEDVNNDTLSDDWLENRTSFIYKVGVLTAIDANKCDWVHVAIGTQRGEKSPFEIKCEMEFNEGENDDIARVLKRALQCLEVIHPVFHED